MKNEACPCEQDLALYLSQDLPAGERDRIDSHVSGCLYCRQQLAALQKPLSTLREARLEISPAETRHFETRVLEATRARHTPGRLQAWGAAATAVAAGLVAAFVLNSNPVPVETSGPAPPRYAEFDMVEDLEMLEHLELLESMDILELMEEQG